LSNDELMRMYRTMLLIRRFEERPSSSISRTVRGSLHPCIGQEATAVGVFALGTDDS
jgi:TPP-dependent pyruvate/acetoin dehydrogenase alpha subunit